MGVLLSQDNNSKEESLAQFNSALESAAESKDQLNILNTIALLHEATENYPDAIEALDRALTIDPENERIKKKIKQLNEMHHNKLHDK